jgi:DNA-binding transcriptional MerR regulator
MLVKLRQLKFAQASGFTLQEISDLLVPLDSEAPLFDHWRKLALTKMEQLDGVIEQSEQMKQRLQQAIACRCTIPEECTLL